MIKKLYKKNSKNIYVYFFKKEVKYISIIYKYQNIYIIIKYKFLKHKFKIIINQHKYFYFIKYIS